MNIGAAMNSRINPNGPNGSMRNVGQKTLGPKAALEAYTRDELDDHKLIAALSLCCSDSETRWEVLSLLDHYHRRGLLEIDVFLTAKTELKMLVFSSEPTSCSGAADRSTMTALDQFSSGML